MEKLKTLLYHKATNRSRPKSTDEPVGNTPKKDKVDKDNIAEIDICFNLQYNTVALKVFYLNNKRSYKIDIPVKDIQHIVDKLKDTIEEPESIFDINIEDDGFDI
jgi:hypothetical protein